MKYTAAYSVNLQIPRERAWGKLKDLSLAPCYVPGVRKMDFLTRKKEGVGTARIVYPQKLREEVLSWKPGKEILLGLSKRGHEKFFPFKKSVFRYSLSETGQTFMKLSLEYEPMMGYLGYLLFGSIVKKRIKRTAISLMNFYKNTNK